VSLNGTQKSELINYGIEKFLQKITIDLNQFIFNFLEINVKHFDNELQKYAKIFLIESNSVNNIFWDWC
jgi:hypothetical protein